MSVDATVGLNLGSTTKDFLARNHGHFINGQWHSSSSGETLDIYNPASGEVIRSSKGITYHCVCVWVWVWVGG